jgi:hypothetical protein
MVCMFSGMLIGGLVGIIAAAAIAPALASTTTAAFLIGQACGTAGAVLGQLGGIGVGFALSRRDS